jgi:hypothetical protein
MQHTLRSNCVRLALRLHLPSSSVGQSPLEEDERVRDGASSARMTKNARDRAFIQTSELQAHHRHPLVCFLVFSKLIGIVPAEFSA